MSDLSTLALDCYSVGAGDRVRMRRDDEQSGRVDSWLDTEIVRVHLSVDSAG